MAVLTMLNKQRSTGLIQFVLDAAEEHDRPSYHQSLRQSERPTVRWLDLIGEAHSLLSAGDMRVCTGQNTFTPRMAKALAR